MKAEDQIIILKALEAIKCSEKNMSVHVLLTPNANYMKLVLILNTMKYKLSVIEGLVNKEVEAQCSPTKIQ